MYLLNKQMTFRLFILVALLPRTATALDHPGPYLPYADYLQVSRIDLSGLNEEAYAKMPLEDVRLKNAYIEVFSSSFVGGLVEPQPEIFAALSDMRKRGDSITPLLLSLLRENQETGFELSVLVGIPAVGTISLEPYLDYARKVLTTRTATMSAGLASSAAHLLASNGTKEDAELLKWVMVTRPYVADSITRKLDELDRWLGLPQQAIPEQITSTKSKIIPDEINNQKNGNSPLLNQENTMHSSWIKWALLVLLVLALLWVAKRKLTLTKF